MQTKIPNFEQGKNTDLPKWVVVLMKAYEEYLKEHENKCSEVGSGK